MKFYLAPLLITTATALPLLGGLLAPIVNGVGSLLGAPNLPNQTGSIITLPILPGTGFNQPNTCRCKAVGSFCGYRAYIGDNKPIEPISGGQCDPLAVYTCNQVDTFGSSATCVLCLASFTGGLGGTETRGGDTCAIRLAGTGN